MTSRHAVSACLLVTAFLTLGLVSSIEAVTIHVPGDAPSIQAGLDMAQYGDIVQVAAGTYYENIIWPAVDGIELAGAGQELTVIDGSYAASVIRFEAADIVGGATHLRDFTVTHGFAQPPWPESQGGGIYLFRAHPVLQDLRIVENTADDFGGGVYCWWANPLLRRVLIADNEAISRGGLDCFHGGPHLDHVTVARNSPGGLYFDTRRSPLVENSIIAFNEDYAIEVFGTYIEPTEIDLAYSDVRGNILEVSVGHVNDLGGNIDEDPLFIDLGAADYHLLAESPCIDAADPDAPPDPDGTRSDMGAYYFDQGTASVDLDSGSEARMWLAAGPNPFAGATRLTYELATAATVRVSIHDMAGRRIRVIDGGFQSPGRHSVSWDARDAGGHPIASGTYLCRLDAGPLSAPLRLVLIR